MTGTMLAGNDRQRAPGNAPIVIADPVVIAGSTGNL